ncbi:MULTISPECIES: class-II fumarase/aspartase family protein [unclassified Pseudocitrobacter]|uniref:class-II fumarase/aspartase family protein n=1 Tax=unclassified Pseudocitrobacter TaxID=2638778 RepID=UPI0023E3D530|nr:MULTISPECIES: adenylosuccinate lyase family protein [unclassified Pseudocitrobacter]MDF3827127.1 adenylosuccinate lyase family protein [Pseudocitrobacter sp. 2023EL-00150]MEC5373072.1 adenylosuccinate lyase family protein [Pseudocitrobacter sp. MW920760]
MRALYDSKSKTLDDRGLKTWLSQQARVQSWLDVEAALALAQAEHGVIPASAAENIAANCRVERIDLLEMDRLLREIGHGFVPVLKVLVKACDSESGKYVHYGVTTQNIQQTAQLSLAKQFDAQIQTFLRDILHNLAAMARAHHDTLMAGRTHGKHALPITWGYKVAVWIEELLSAQERMREAEKRIFTVMMGGAVGAFHATGETGRKVQESVARRLGMHSMAIPSRNSRVYRMEYISNLCLLATTLHKIAEEVYQTSGEEFGEVSEAFTKGTVGSSTMPQKVNPKLAKGIIGNAQKLYSVLTSCLYVTSRPFEADSSAYFIFDANIQESMECITEIVMRAEELTRTLVIHRERMQQNAQLTHGLINSEKIMMQLVEKLGKDAAHERVYQLAMRSTHESLPYADVLRQDYVIREHFSDEEIAALLDPAHYLGLCSQIAREAADRVDALK